MVWKIFEHVELKERNAKRRNSQDLNPETAMHESIILFASAPLRPRLLVQITLGRERLLVPMANLLRESEACSDQQIRCRLS